MREKLSMDFAWRFHTDKLEHPEQVEMMYYYNHTKAERARGPAAPSFYDYDWQIVDLPHDYAVNSAPDFTYTNCHGFIRRYNAWYRRLFALDPSDKGKRILLQFDGVATNCTVWVNGHLMHRNFCGYTSFSIDITDVADYRDMYNHIAVYVDTSDFEGWWYEGAGIYRHVWLIKSSDLCIANWGTFVKTEKKENEHWEIDVETKLCNISYIERRVTLFSRVIDAEGNVVSECSQDETVPPREELAAKTKISVDKPELWSIESPNLYTLRSIIKENGKEIDSYDTTFGFRTLLYTENGFFLNRNQVKFKGVCAHDDQANLGVAIPDDVRADRMRMLKFIGCNAYRCSHNPPAPETLELCDRLGILVMDENRWFDSSVEGLNQLRSMIIRDRNHPCIVMWSMANEEPLQGCERGRFIMSSMVHLTRRLDNTRPIMMAMHSGLLSNEVTSVSDIIGINYNENIFDDIHAAHPGIPLLASEIGGKLTETGVMDDASGEDWEAVDTRPFFLGMFKWVAFGYRGESRAWPRLYSRSGIIEANLLPKENTWFYKQMWDDSMFVKIYPFHWNWDGKEGEKIQVKVYTTAEEVQLFLNGKSLGCQKVNPYRRTTFDAIYERGELKAVAYKNGIEAGSDIINTTGDPSKVILTPNRDSVSANRTDVITITAAVQDNEGKPVLWSNDRIFFKVTGPAVILAVSSSDPYEALGPKVPERKLHNGVCQLILRTTTVPGDIYVKAEADGMESAGFVITSKACKRAPHVEIETSIDSLVYFAKMQGQN